LILEEGRVLLPEGLTDEFPVFLVFVCVHKFNGIQKFHMNKANDEPDVESPFVLMPTLGKFVQNLAFVPTMTPIVLFFKFCIDHTSILDREAVETINLYIVFLF
jgi:hypothetical protein